jgi:Ca2+-binding RTX toxin-like protein
MNLFSILTKSVKRTHATRKPRQTQLAVEALEERRLFSVDISFSQGVLTLVGSNRDDRKDIADVRVFGNKVKAEITELDGNGRRKDHEDKTVDFDKVTKIVFKGLKGHDQFTNYTTIRSDAFGGDGNDTLTGGSGNDLLQGENGNDRLNGKAGNDVLYGHAGNDWLDGEDGRDYLAGGTGNDSLYGGAHFDQLLGEGGRDWLYGGTDGDWLYGGADADYLFGNEGNDWLYGQNGNDWLGGGTGDDYLYGGNDQDYLWGDAGLDRLNGEAGNDNLNGGNDGANDSLTGGTGADTFVRYYSPVLLFFKSYDEDVTDFNGSQGDRTQEYQK